MRTKTIHRTRSRAKNNSENLIDVLYTSPEKVAEWFKKNHVNISMNECEKIMIHL